MKPTHGTAGTQAGARLAAALCLVAAWLACASCEARGPRVPTCRVDAAGDTHDIPAEIYGVAAAPVDVLRELRVPLDRWGGNTASRYNWSLGNAWNAGNDWFFENTAVEPDAWKRFLAGCREADASALITLPLVGYVARDTGSYSFSVTRYGPQKAVDPHRPDAGNGVRPDGTPLTGNDPLDASVPCGPDCAAAWVSAMGDSFPDLFARGRVIFSLGNEPMLWNIGQRDVHPEPVTYDEYLDRFLRTAQAVKAAAPGARIAGPELWGWPAYTQSAADREGKDDADRKAHGNLPFLPWFLQEMHRHEKRTGQRLLDLVTVHFYPQAQGVYSDEDSPAVQRLRLDSVRSLYDPKYEDPSWIAARVELIPRLRRWVEQYYPGLGVGITEYNWGGQKTVSGALALADILGIFGQYRLDLACLWTYPPPGTPASAAYALYRNADGRGACFGDRSLPVAWSRKPGPDEDLSVYAALDRTSSALTLIVINKALELSELRVEIQGLSLGDGTGYVLRTPGTALEPVAGPVTVLNRSVEVLLPPLSAHHLRFPVLPRAEPRP